MWGDSDPDPATARITNIHLTANDPNEDMGIYVPGRLGDNVLCLSTGQGLADITVNLFRDLTVTAWWMVRQSPPGRLMLWASTSSPVWKWHWQAIPTT